MDSGFRNEIHLNLKIETPKLTENIFWGNQKPISFTMKDIKIHNSISIMQRYS